MPHMMITSTPQLRSMFVQALAAAIPASSVSTVTTIRWGRPGVRLGSVPA
jgi:hypothetical protein